MYFQDVDIIKSRMLDNLNLDIDKREGSFINDMYSPMANEFTKAYMEMDNVHSILFVESCFGDNLDKRAGDFGIDRKQGEKSNGVITFRGSKDTLIPRNMRIYTDGGFEYITISQGYIVEDTVDIEVESVNVGTIYNIEPNAIWKKPNDVIVDDLFNSSGFTGGIDIESDDSYKRRFFDAVQNVRTSGNVNDYKHWSKEIVGVENVDVYPLWNGNGTVKVVISGENRLPVHDEALNNCKYHLADVSPIGATVTVVTTELFNVSIDVTVSIDTEYNTDDVKLEIEKSIRDYIGTCIDKIYYNKLGAKILSCNGVIDYTILTVNGSSESIITIPADNVANIQGINITTSVGVLDE